MTVKVSEAEPPAFSLILARHASTEASEARRLLGALDEPLSKRGTQEAADLAHAIAARLDRAGLASADGRVLTSPLTRAVQTASVIAKALGWRMDVRDDFRERDFGTWAGRSIDELTRSAPIVAAQFVKDPLSVNPDGAESMAEFQHRVFHCWAHVSETLRRNESIIVVTHDGPIRAILWSIGFYGVAAVPLYAIPACSYTLLRRMSSLAWTVVEGLPSIPG